MATTPHNCEAQANGDAFALFLLGTPSSMGRGVETQRSYIYGHAFGFYAQDDWRISKRLTLNLGLRYDYVMAFKEKNGRFSSWDPLTGEVIYPDNTSLTFIDVSTGQLVLIRRLSRIVSPRIEAS